MLPGFEVSIPGSTRRELRAGKSCVLIDTIPDENEEEGQDEVRGRQRREQRWRWRRHWNRRSIVNGKVVQSGAAGYGKGFVTCFLKVLLACLGSRAAAVQPNCLWNSQKTCYNTFSSTCRPRLHNDSFSESFSRATLCGVWSVMISCKTFLKCSTAVGLIQKLLCSPNGNRNLRLTTRQNIMTVRTPHSVQFISIFLGVYCNDVKDGQLDVTPEMIWLSKYSCYTKWPSKTGASNLEFNTQQLGLPRPRLYLQGLQGKCWTLEDKPVPRSAFTTARITRNKSRQQKV